MPDTNHGTETGGTVFWSGGGSGWRAATLSRARGARGGDAEGVGLSGPRGPRLRRPRSPRVRGADDEGPGGGQAARRDGRRVGAARGGRDRRAEAAGEAHHRPSDRPAGAGRREAPGAPGGDGPRAGQARDRPRGPRAAPQGGDRARRPGLQAGRGLRSPISARCSRPSSGPSSSPSPTASTPKARCTETPRVSSRGGTGCRRSPVDNDLVTPRSFIRAGDEGPPGETAAPSGPVHRVLGMTRLRFPRDDNHDALPSPHPWPSGS